MPDSNPRDLSPRSLVRSVCDMHIYLFLIAVVYISFLCRLLFDLLVRMLFHAVVLHLLYLNIKWITAFYLQLENWQRITQCSPAAWWNNSYNYSNSVPVPAKHTGVGSLALLPKRCKKDSWCANLHDFYKQALLFANCLSCRRTQALKGQCRETFSLPLPHLCQKKTAGVPVARYFYPPILVR